MPENELRKVKLYAWIMFFGSASALGMFFFYGIPITIQVIGYAISSIHMGLTMGIPKIVIDGALSLLITGGTQVLLLVMLYRMFVNRLMERWTEKLRECRGVAQSPTS